MSPRTIALAAVPFTLATLASVASAQAAPKFEYGKAEDVKDVKETEWTATAEAGLVLTTGNSRTTTATGGLKATRKQQKNKLAFEAAGTLTTTSDLTFDGTPGADGVSQNDYTRTDKTSAKNYNSKLRYDRFLTEHNSVFIAALAGADPIAGKDFVGGGQLGYARQLYATEQHTTSGEFGYDFSYENFATEDPAAVQSVQIHSARGFIGHKAKLSEDTAFEGSIEALDNLNANAAADRFDDLRVNVAGSLSTKLTKAISFSFSFTAKFDNVPAPFAAPAGFMLSPTNPPENSKMDTTTKASLIVTLL